MGCLDFLFGEEDENVKHELAVTPGTMPEDGSLVRMISGCRDDQTSADVFDTASFHLPSGYGGGAGGACTHAFLSCVLQKKQHTWIQLLEEMRETLEKKNFTQRPQLSSTHELDLHHTLFDIIHPKATASNQKRAVIIGINYVGQDGELKGCHNDAEKVIDFLQGQYGFRSNEITVLMDDDRNIKPTAQNIKRELMQLVSSLKSGDTGFVHFSGHGVGIRDQNSEEADQQDEALVPVDYEDGGGLILDDWLYRELVASCSPGVLLTCMFDCCNSGTALDLGWQIQAKRHLGRNVAMVHTDALKLHRANEMKK